MDRGSPVLGRGLFGRLVWCGGGGLLGCGRGGGIANVPKEASEEVDQLRGRKRTDGVGPQLGGNWCGGGSSGQHISQPRQRPLCVALPLVRAHIRQGPAERTLGALAQKGTDGNLQCSHGAELATTPSAQRAMGLAHVRDAVAAEGVSAGAHRRWVTHDLGADDTRHVVRYLGPVHHPLFGVPHWQLWAGRPVVAVRHPIVVVHAEGTHHWVVVAVHVVVAEPMGAAGHVIATVRQAVVVPMWPEWVTVSHLGGVLVHAKLVGIGFPLGLTVALHLSLHMQHVLVLSQLTLHLGLLNPHVPGLFVIFPLAVLLVALPVIAHLLHQLPLSRLQRCFVAPHPRKSVLRDTMLRLRTDPLKSAPVLESPYLGLVVGGLSGGTLRAAGTWTCLLDLSLASGDGRPNRVGWVVAHLAGNPRRTWGLFRGLAADNGGVRHGPRWHRWLWEGGSSQTTVNGGCGAAVGGQRGHLSVWGNTWGKRNMGEEPK